MSQSPVGSDLLQTFKIFTQFGLHVICHDLKSPSEKLAYNINEYGLRNGLTNLIAYLGILAILDILLSVEEPVRDLILTRIRHNGDYFVNLDKPSFNYSIVIL